MAAADRQHVQRISRDRYYIGRGEQNPLAEDMHHAVNYLGQELLEPAPELRARLEEKEGSQPSQGTGQTSRCLARPLGRSTLLSRTICLEFIVSR